MTAFDPIAELRRMVNGAETTEWPEPYERSAARDGWRERHVDTAQFLRLLGLVEEEVRRLRAIEAAVREEAAR